MSAFLLLPSAIAAAAPYPLACVYVSARGLESAPRCASRSAGGLRIAPGVRRDLHFDRGLATLGVAGRWSYLRRDGRTVEMLTFDNGPDPFSEGWARGRIAGRLVYVDRRLRVRLRPPFTFGGPFRGARAEVCTGCVETRVDGGEHTVMTGGRWAVIDRRGHEVAPTSPSHSTA